MDISSHSTTKDGSIPITRLNSHSLRSRLFYLILRFFYSPILSKITSRPTASGHQNVEIPPSLRKRFSITRRDFHDWTVYDVSRKESQRYGGTTRQDGLPTRRVMYIPGTGFTKPASSEHLKFASEAFAVESAIVTIVLHPLAPKHRVLSVYPKLFDLYEILLKELAPGGYMDIGGDSSGGGMAVSMVQQLKTRGLALPRKLFLMAPSLDFTQSEISSMRRIERVDPLQTAMDSHEEHLKWIGDDIDVSDPMVSPIFGDLKTLREVEVICAIGTYDILGPDCMRLKEKLEVVGVKGKWLVAERMVHCWVLLQAHKLPEAMQAMQWIIDMMR
ncbi:Esterase [Dactylella cylindrospora]|nr:Esterase [Dactylella cylindrospora]